MLETTFILEHVHNGEYFRNIHPIHTSLFSGKLFDLCLSCDEPLFYEEGIISLIECWKVKDTWGEEPAEPNFQILMSRKGEVCTSEISCSEVAFLPKIYKDYEDFLVSSVDILEELQVQGPSPEFFSRSLRCFPNIHDLLMGKAAYDLETFFLELESRFPNRKLRVYGGCLD
jgi:hypothetical protein